MKRIAFYGGSFDPLHSGHLMIAKALTDQFQLDSFVFIPAFHAPHKKDKNPTSPFHRHAMIALSTSEFSKIKVSNIELESPEKPYSVETLTKLKTEHPTDQIFFVIGADSWQEITTWREWETVLTIVNVIVVTRPGYEIGFDHVTNETRKRIVDLRVSGELDKTQLGTSDLGLGTHIFLSDAVQANISATEIRLKIRNSTKDWREFLPNEVANYIEKYDLYL